MSIKSLALGLGIALSFINPALSEESTMERLMREGLTTAVENCVSDPEASSDTILRIYQRAQSTGTAKSLEDILVMPSVANCINSSVNYVDARFRWYPEAGRLMSADEYLDWSGSEFAKKVMEDAAERQIELEAQDNARMAELGRRTLEACFELESRDPVSAYTNPVCHKFFQLELPNW